MQPLRSSAKAIPAFAGTSPLLSADDGSQVLQEPAHAAPDPQGPFLPESNHLRLATLPSNRGRSGRSESNALLEVYGLGCNGYTMPRPSSKAQNTRARAQYAGKPATGRLGLVFVAIRVMLAGPRKLHVFQHGGVASAVAD